MSAEYRTPEEYAKAFAIAHHKTNEQAEQCVTVSLFKSYTDEREKHEQERIKKG